MCSFISGVTAFDSLGSQQLLERLFLGNLTAWCHCFCCVCVDSTCMSCFISAFISQLVIFIWLHVSLLIFLAHNQLAVRTWLSLFKYSPTIVCYFEEWSPASQLSVECIWVTSTPVILGQAELYSSLRKRTHAQQTQQDEFKWGLIKNMFIHCPDVRNRNQLEKVKCCFFYIFS